MAADFFGRRFLQLIVLYHHEIVPLHLIAVDDLFCRQLYAGRFRDALIADFWNDPSCAAGSS
jgi:hypothetical protein